VERGFIVTPQSMFGTIDDSARRQIISSSPMSGKYDREIDRESAYELLQVQVRQEQAAVQEEAEKIEKQKE